MRVLVQWVASLLRLDYVYPEFRGSGDTLYHYISLLVITCFSLIACLIWSLLDRVSKNYNRLFYWLTVAVRFYVGLMLVNYGLFKVFKTQFPAPTFTRLMQPYGESSPMGLAWTFLGFSKGYNLFMGFAELMGGLLLFRRTVTIGAIIALMTTANVMAVNYFFDVPVKLLSTALVVMCLFLLVPNFYRLFNFFVNGQGVALKEIKPPEMEEKWVVTLLGTKYLIILITIVLTISMQLKFRTQYSDSAPRLPLYGGYLSETKILDSAASDAFVYSNWKKVSIQYKKYSSVVFTDGFTQYGSLNIDTVKKSISFIFGKGPGETHHFSYEKTDEDHLTLSGKNLPVTIQLTKQNFLLMDRGFHWITEIPFNR